MNKKFFWTLIREGEPDAYRTLYDKYADQMYGYGMKVLDDRLLVEDAIQTVFFKSLSIKTE